MPPELINNLPSPGEIDNTDIAAIQERADDMNDYNSNNSVTERVAVVKIKHAIMFPVENQGALDDFNALSETDQAIQYNNWLKSLSSYPPF
jgi:hypothetical protein